ncbi:DUF6894 family protein [Phenylobacterium sp. VNQ135]|uniref:DUF6894 family protein n=1 Tax=Phenylobacterium sp. VNQ135 TaxID=3400922 RepID=UPI003C01DB89
MAASLPMETFYFHSSGALPHRDDEGVELPNRGAAEVEALRVVGELLKDGQGWLWGPEPLVLQVTDADAEEILRVEVSARRTARRP